MIRNHDDVFLRSTLNVSFNTIFDGFDNLIIKQVKSVCEIVCDAIFLLTLQLVKALMVKKL